MVTLARFPCAAVIHYCHDVQLNIDDQRCEECIAMARALLTCFGERLAEENCFTIAIMLSFRLTRRIFAGRTSKLIACWYLHVHNTVYRPCLRSSTLCHVLPNAGVLRVPQVIEGFGEQAMAKPLSAASGRQ